MRYLLGCVLALTAAATVAADEAPKSAHLDRLGDPLPAHALARLGSTCWRQRYSIFSLSYSADGKLLAAISDDEGFCLLDAVSGKRLFQLPLEYEQLRGMTLPDNGRWRAVKNKAGTALELHETATDKKLGEIAGKGSGRLTLTGNLVDSGRVKGSASTVTFTPDGKTMLRGNGKRLRIWDVASGRELRRLEGPAALFVLSGDGRTLVTRDQKCLRVVDLTSGIERRRLPTPDDDLDTRFEKLAVSSDGSLAALAGHGYLFAWETATGKERLRRTETSGVTTVAFRPGSHVLTFACMYDPAIHRWDLGEGKEVLASPGHEGAVQTVAFARDGKALVSGGEDNMVRFWILEPGHEGALRPPFALAPSYLLALRGRIAASADGKWLAVPGPEGEVHMIDAFTQRRTQKLRGSSGCCCLAFSADKRLVVSGDSYYGDSPKPHPQGRAYIWEVATGKLLHVLKGHGNVVRAVAFSPDGKTVASASDGVRLWDVASGQLVGRFAQHGDIDAIGFTPDGKTLAAGGAGAVLWNIATGQELHRLGGTGYVAGLAISPDGKLVATGGEDRSVRLWDLVGGTEKAQLPGHTGRIHSVAFAHDGKRLASGSSDSTILLWDVPAALAAAWIKAR